MVRTECDGISINNMNNTETVDKVYLSLIKKYGNRKR